MRSQPSTHPRDEAIRAALRDATALASILAGEFFASYDGPQRSEYLRVLGDIVADLGGTLADEPSGTVAAFEGRRIAIRFGTLSGR
jgi:hypothetical protein